MPEPVKPVKKDWKKFVEEHKNSLFFVPEKLLPQVKEWHEKKVAFDKKIEELSKEEVITSNLMQNMFLALRDHLEAAGQENVWGKDISLEMSALKEGQYIVVLTEPSSPIDAFRPR